MTRTRSNEEFKRVAKVAQPEKDEVSMKAIIDLVKKWLLG